MSTVREVLDEFLEEQRARLGPGMYMYYERTVELLEAYMDRNPMHFIRHTGVPPERPSRGRTATCCDTLGPDVIDAGLLLDFLHSHMVREVRCGRTLMRMAITVIKRLVGWLHGRGLMDDQERQKALDGVRGIKGYLPGIVDMARRMAEHVERNPAGEHTEAVDGHFTVTRIEPGALWLRDCIHGGEEMGPVPVSERVTAACVEGWTIRLGLGRTEEGWRVLWSGRAYPF